MTKFQFITKEGITSIKNHAEHRLKTDCFCNENVPAQYEFIHNIERREFEDVRFVYQMLGYSSDVFTPSFFIDLIHPDERELFVEAIKEGINVLKDETADANEIYLYASYRIKRSNGEYAYIIHRSFVESIVAGIVSKTRNICVDISEFGFAPVLCVKYFSPQGMQDVFSNETASLGCLLSKQELTVLKKVSEGLHCQEIAEELGISIHTVHTHRRNILRKTNSQNIIEAISRVFKAGHCWG